MMEVGPFQLTLSGLEGEVWIVIMLAGLIGLLAGFLLGAGGRGRVFLWFERLIGLPLLALVLGAAVWVVTVPTEVVGEYPLQVVETPQSPGGLVEEQAVEPQLQILFEPPEEEELEVPADTGTPAPSSESPEQTEPKPTVENKRAREEQPDLSSIWRLVIPALDLDVSVEAKPQANGTWDITGLGERVAFLVGTAHPGEGGNTVLAGHVTVRGFGRGPFYTMHKAVTGTRMYVYTEENLYIYQVREQFVVNAEDGSPALATSKPQLTLVTCTGWDEKAKLYRKRRIVTADLWNIRPLESEIK